MNELKTFEILNTGIEMGKQIANEQWQNDFNDFMPKYRKIDICGTAMACTYSAIREVALAPRTVKGYRAKRLDFLGSLLSKQITSWIHAYAAAGIEIQNSDLRILMSDVLGGIASYIRTNDRRELYRQFKQFPANIELIELVDKFTPKEPVVDRLCAKFELQLSANQGEPDYHFIDAFNDVHTKLETDHSTDELIEEWQQIEAWKSGYKEDNVQRQLNRWRSRQN